MQTPKIVLWLSVIVVLLAVSVAPAQAAKVRVWSTASSKTTTTAGRPSYSVKLRSDRKALTVYFYSLATAKSIDYELTYNGNGVDQGVFGTVTPADGSSTSRLLLFGTCSHNVCTYHSNIQNSTLKITAKATNGKTYIKRYRIRV